MSLDRDTVTFAACFSRDEVPSDVSGRLYQLEVMLQQLNNDLEKVRLVLNTNPSNEFQNVAELLLLFYWDLMDRHTSVIIGKWREKIFLTKTIKTLIFFVTLYFF